MAGETIGDLFMTGRLCRHDGSARGNQGMAGETGGNSQTGPNSDSCGSSLDPTLSKLLHLILILALLSALAIVPTSAESIDTCHASVRIPTPVTAVHVQPDDGPQPILDEINFAACSIDLSMYIFTNQDIFEALEYAVARGIRVRVILEREPFGSFGSQQEMFDRLIEIGAEVQWGPEQFTFSHAKYMVVDASVLIVTNQNFTNAGFDSNREFGVTTTEPGHVHEASSIFESDWSRSKAPVSFDHLVVSPTNSLNTIVEMIDSSTKSVWMYSEVLRDEDITSALNSAAERDVDVRILVNPTADEDDAPYFLDALEHGVQIRVLRDPYVHSKVMIVDGESALVGSQNYSYTSLNLNREVGIVLTDLVNLKKIETVYSRDWVRGEPANTISRRENRPIRPDFALTQPATIGRISSVRWRVV